MARLIVKSPYIKCGGGRSAGGYMRYIATRERVELIQDDRSPTRKKKQLIVKLVKDFPEARELDEYADYQEHPNKANASAFISQALEENWSDVQKSDGYMKYIATRPRAERLGSHGLFGDKDGVELDKAMAELENYTGNVWTHIISLKREDAERLGYDNARAWRNLLRAHRNDIAAAMSIPPQDFRWYAAFHDEGDHPHCHMMAWSVKPGQAYEFDGWYTKQSGGEKITASTVVNLTSDQTLYAHWKEWGPWSEWSTTPAYASSTRQVETREVKVSDSYTEYRYGRYVASGHDCWCGKYLEGLSYVSESARLQYSPWSTTQYGTSGRGWSCGPCSARHIGVDHTGSDGRSWWAEYLLPDGSYYWQETQTVGAVYETQYRYRDLIQ